MNNYLITIKGCLLDISLVSCFDDAVFRERSEGGRFPQKNDWWWLVGVSTLWYIVTSILTTDVTTHSTHDILRISIDISVSIFQKSNRYSIESKNPIWPITTVLSQLAWSCKTIMQLYWTSQSKNRHSSGRGGCSAGGAQTVSHQAHHAATLKQESSRR